MGRVVGWAVTLLLAVAAVISLDPARVGLSTVVPVAQVLPFRTVLAAAFVLAGLALLLAALAGALRRRGGTRRTVLAAVLLLVGAGHGWVTLDRGVTNDGALGAEPGAADITVLTLNTYGGASSAEEVAVAAVDVGADVLTLPETAADDAARVAALIASSGGPTFQVFVRTSGGWDARSTALLVSERLGRYAEAEGPGTTLGSVRAEPVDGAGPVLVAVHPVAPVAEAMEEWEADLEAVMEVCRATPGVIVAGDFNATLDHGPMRDAGACVDGAVAAGVGGVATWPARLPALVGTTIDHVLVDGGAFDVVDGAVLEVGGSDHRAVAVRMAPRPAAR
ncbi:endonuclease/exonuclease/phosphatase family protein [Georgenia wangjunii]|uniref:endonuclease/exonuclease/phosphatase family protein n=1 Tax=Georgenia wangjunii TaxID=3117730 RepID=UPI002F26DDD8